MVRIRMDENQKKYFCTLCSATSIAQAAQMLYLSRQGLSKSMKNLEGQLGVQLFLRGKQGIELTSAGIALLHYLREEDRLWNTYMADIHPIDSEEPEHLRIGLLSMYVGYKEKRELFASFPNSSTTEIEIIDGDHDVFWKAIAAGDMDFAITLNPPEELGFSTIKLDNDRLSILMSADNPLSKHDYIDFKADLSGKRVIQTSPYKGRLYEKIFRNHSIDSRPLIHDKDLMLARVSTSEDFFIIQDQYAKALTADHVCMKPLVNSPIEMNSTFVFHSDLGPSAKTAAKKILRSYGKEKEFDAFFETPLLSR